MRILFFTHYFYPECNAPAVRVHELGQRWVKQGHKVHVITCVPNVPNGIIYEGYKNKLKQTEFVDGIHVTRVWTYVAANKGKVRRILNYISYLISAVMVGLFIKKPDVVIATSPQFFCGWAGAILAKIRHLPFILEIRDIWPASIVAVGAMRESVFIRVLNFLELRLYSLADHVVTVGWGYRDNLLNKSVPAQKLSVIMNGVDPELFTPRRPDLCLQSRLGINGQFVCSYVGTVGMASGLSVVLRAGQLLQNMGRRDISFLIVGDGAVRSQLQSEAERLGLTNVLFVGQQCRAMIPRYLSIADACLVHLRKSRLFEIVMPSKIFEAAGMAKPLIIGVRGFAERFVLDANAGVAIEPENEQDLVDAVLKLAENRTLGAEYGRSGYQFVTENYTRDKLAEDYLVVIHDLLGRMNDFVPAKLVSTPGHRS